MVLLIFIFESSQSRIVRIERRKMSNELLGYFKDRYNSRTKWFVQSEGNSIYKDGWLTVKHSNSDILADFVKSIDEVSLHLFLTTNFDLIFFRSLSV